MKTKEVKVTLYKEWSDGRDEELDIVVTVPDDIQTPMYVYAKLYEDLKIMNRYRPHYVKDYVEYIANTVGMFGDSLS